MHGLGIPTTRAFCIVGSDQKVHRETVETGAVLLRLSPSHVRFGSFEVFYYRKQYEHITTLADYVIARHFSNVVHEEEKYPRFLSEVVLSTARLIAKWQAVGFAHGVMNTDNMSILGLTFDYGPFGFMDHYDPGFICNHSDHEGHYAFNQQPQIGLWNLNRLAQALIPLISVEQAKEALACYEPAFVTHYEELMRQKLGLREFHSGDVSLVSGFLEIMHTDRVDYTNCFRALGNFRQAETEGNASLRGMFINREAFDRWAEGYRARLSAERSRDGERKGRMDRVNPKYVLRNYLAQIAIGKAAENQDYSEIDRLLALLRDPYREQPSMEDYAAPPPAWARDIQVSCSS
jgi:uncharacterized protein YdiU (UPF0061 family)